MQITLSAKYAKLTCGRFEELRYLEPTTIRKNLVSKRSIYHTLFIAENLKNFRKQKFAALLNVSELKLVYNLSKKKQAKADHIIIALST